MILCIMGDMEQLRAGSRELSALAGGPLLGQNDDDGLCILHRRVAADPSTHTHDSHAEECDQREGSSVSF